MPDANAVTSGDRALVAAAMTTVDPDALASAVDLSRWVDVEFVLRSKKFEPPGRHDGFGGELNAHTIGDSVIGKVGDLVHEPKSNTPCWCGGLVGRPERWAGLFTGQKSIDDILKASNYMWDHSDATAAPRCRCA